MAGTNVRGGQIKDATIQRVDLDVSTVGQAVIAKLLQGSGITLSSTGGDAGTGDVTVNAAIQTVFGRTGAIVAAVGDYSAYYAALAAGLPTGGTVGQFLRKNSSTNYDCSWAQGASVQGAVTTTTGTTSTAGVMAGLPGAITPVTTGRILIMLSGSFVASVAGFGVAGTIRYGTGTAPVQGAAPTGTLVGPTASGVSPAANNAEAFALMAIVTGLTLGTAYWLDMAYASNSATSTAKLQTCAICAIEF